MLGLGMGLGRGRSSVLHAWDFTTAPVVGGAFTLPPWLAIACATTGRTAQDSASTLTTGFGANVARRRRASSTNELLLDCQRAVIAPALANWFKGGAATLTSAHTGPDGTSSAKLLTWVDALDAAYPSDTGGAGLPQILAGHASVLSVWCLANGLTTEIDIFDGNAGQFASELTIGATWQLLSLSKAAQASDVDWGIGASPVVLTAPAGSAWLYGAQIENNAKYFTSLLGATGTRAADKLSIVSPVEVARGGYFDATLRFTTDFASGEMGSALDLLNFGTVKATLGTDSKITLHTGGADVVSPALTLTRGGELVVRLAHRRSGRRIEATGVVPTTGGVDSSFSVPGTAYLFGSSTGTQESVGARVVEFFGD
jgi:hypothetical protein